MVDHVPHFALGVALVVCQFCEQRDAIGQRATGVQSERVMTAVAQVRRVVVEPAPREGPVRYRVEGTGLPVLNLSYEAARKIREAVVPLELLAVQEARDDQP